MSTNKPISDELPGWLWTIVEKQDLGLRADTPRGGMMVLLVEARDLVAEIATAAVSEQWLTPSNKQRLHKAIDMLVDADRLSSVSQD